jgi:hypothetical protein
MPTRSPRRPRLGRVLRHPAVLVPVAALALAAPAGASSWSPGVPVPDGAVGAPAESAKRAGPTATQAADGTTWVAWLQSAGTTADTVRVARRAPDGTWGAAETVATRPRVDGEAGNGLLRGPAIDVGPGGRPVVLWSVNDGSGNLHELRAARRGADGAWSAPHVLGDESDGGGGANDGSVAIHHAADGRTVAAWRAGANVHAAVLGTDGAWSATATLGNDLVDVPPALREVDVTSDAEGRITVAWAGAAGPETSTRNESGTWSAARTVAESGVGSPPRVAADAQGELLVAWAAGDGDARVARAASLGGDWAAEAVAFDEDGTAATIAPDVAFDHHGVATLVSTDTDVVDGTTTAAVRARLRRPDGSWAAPTTVRSAAGAEAPGASRVVVGHDGQATVLWTAGPILSGRLFAATREGGDGAWGPAVALTDPEVLRNRVSDGVAADALGNVAVALAPAQAVAAATATAPVLRTLDAAPAVGTSWSARWLPGTFNLRTFVNYLHGAPDGGVFPSDGASRPEPLDRYGVRLTVADAWRDVDTGETVVEHRGVVRMSMPIHFIDIRIVDPTVRIAADGSSARVIASGQGSGVMDPTATTPKVEPFEDVELIDLDLAAGAVRAGDAGAVRTYVAAPARIAAGDAGRYLAYPEGTPYGAFTITVPAQLPDRDPPPPADGGGGDGGGGGDDGGGGGPTPVPPTGDDGSAPPPPGPGTTPAPTPPGPTPDPVKPGPAGSSTPKRVTARLSGSRAARRSVRLTTSVRIGARATRTYRVRLLRGGRTVATGTLRGRTLRLTLRRTGRTRGGKARYPRLTGSYALRANGGAAANRIPATTIRVR